MAITPKSFVKFHVRENVLELKEFTVAQMVGATGLNPKSIRTELQRMRREGLLTADAKAEPNGRRGGPASVYRLTPDFEKIQKLSRQLKAFYRKPSEAPRPVSRFYINANNLLNQLAAGAFEDAAERGNILQQVRQALALAWHTEGNKSAVIGAFIKFESARLEYLNENYGNAEELFREVSNIFVAANFNEEAAQTEEYLECINLYRQFRETPGSSPESEATIVLRKLRQFKSAAWANHPLLVMLVGLMKVLIAYTTRAKVLENSRSQMGRVYEQPSKLVASNINSRTHAPLRDLRLVNTRVRSMVGDFGSVARDKGLVEHEQTLMNRELGSKRGVERDLFSVKQGHETYLKNRDVLVIDSHTWSDLHGERTYH